MPVFRDVHFERPELQIRSGVFSNGGRPDRVPLSVKPLMTGKTCVEMLAMVVAYQGAAEAARRLAGQMGTELAETNAAAAEANAHEAMDIFCEECNGNGTYLDVCGMQGTKII